MAIVDARHLLQHATAAGYRVPAMGVAGIEDAVAALDAAARAGSAIALSVSGGRLSLPADIVMPAIEIAADRAAVPVVLRWDDVADEAALADALRLGCSALVLSPRAAPGEELAGLAARSGALALLPGDAGFLDIDLPRGSPLEVRLGASPGAGKAPAALESVRRWRPVEHVVMFNAPDLSEPEVQTMFELGARKLGAIPGVRDVRFGRAEKADARFRLCWFVRFASEAVVESYRHHPMHVDFADNHFRPFAADRLTTDFLIL